MACTRPGERGTGDRSPGGDNARGCFLDGRCPGGDRSCRGVCPYVFDQGNWGCIEPGTGQHGGVADLLWGDVKYFFDPVPLGKSSLLVKPHIGTR